MAKRTHTYSFHSEAMLVVDVVASSRDKAEERFDDLLNKLRVSVSVGRLRRGEYAEVQTGVGDSELNTSDDPRAFEEG